MVRTCVAALLLVGSLGVGAFAQNATDKPAKPAATVNLNTASVAELETLPGIGTRVAERIVEYRKQKGAFKKIEELMNVQGIGEKSFLKLRAQITVGSAKADAGQQ